MNLSEFLAHHTLLDADAGNELATRSPIGLEIRTHT